MTVPRTLQRHEYLLPKKHTAVIKSRTHVLHCEYIGPFGYDTIISMKNERVHVRVRAQKPYWYIEEETR